MQPEWTQPTLPAAEVRAQNGMPAPPVPIVPNQFTIQLYNPDQQVIVRQIAGSWNSSAHWEFEMPQNSFRQPSVSALDRSQNDPAASDVTPKIAFKWKRDGKLSKDISCYLAGKSTDGRKNKEPDIAVAMFKSGKDLTIYEPNMHRVDVEDAKGLEVVFLLSAAVIKDIFFNANRDMFNISSPNTASTNTKRKNSGPVIPIGKSNNSPPPMMSGAAYSTPPSRVPASQIPPQQQASRTQQQAARPPPTANARSQWEIDAETARLKALVEQEEKQQKEREKRDREEQRRIKKMLEAEEKEAEKERRRRDAQDAKETERLKKLYGVPSTDTSPPRVSFAAPAMPPRPQNWNASAPPLQQYQSAPHSQPVPVQRPLSTPAGPSNVTTNASLNTWLQRPNQGPYLQAPGQGTASSSGFFGLGPKKVQKKRSVFF